MAFILPVSAVSSIKLKILLPMGMASLLILSVQGPGWRPVQSKQIETSSCDFRDGDLIFRRGVSLQSRTILALDRRAAYSHVGIIRKNGTQVEVIHASYEEEGQARDGVVSEPLEVFLKPTNASAAAVSRFSGNHSELPILALRRAEQFLRGEIPFDTAFDLDTPDKLYCTELVWLAYKSAGVDLTDGHFDTLPLSVDKKPYILPGSLYRSTQLQVVWTSSEK